MQMKCWQENKTIDGRHLEEKIRKYIAGVANEDIISGLF